MVTEAGCSREVEHYHRQISKAMSQIGTRSLKVSLREVVRFVALWRPFFSRGCFSSLVIIPVPSMPLSCRKTTRT